MQDPVVDTAAPFDPKTDLGRSYLAVDWAATPLGTPDTWSDSLRSTVRLMLASRFSMWMGWGPELTFFCNEAYRRDTLAEKYPWALGRPTSEVWSELWDQIIDRIDAVTQKGDSTWDEALQLFVLRSGYLEETYHTFSYSPLTEGDGSIEGLLCVVQEVTIGTVNERRIATLNDFSVALAGAATQSQVFAAAQEQLSTNPFDLPFIAGYVQEPGSRYATRSWACGIDSGHPAAPDVIDLHDPAGPWTDAVAAGGGVVDAVDARYPDLPVGPHGARPDTVVVEAITQPGVRSALGFFIAGVSPHRPLNDEYRDFVASLAAQFAAALARARAYDTERDLAEQLVAREHGIARDLQSSLLPELSYDADHLDVATFYQAGVEGTTVGGDWYDVIDLGPGRTALVIGDVMGRGVQAAAVMGQLRATTRAYARLELAPDVVLGLLDEFVRDLGANKIVTCVYAIYDPGERTLQYANAGHLPPLLTLPGGGTQALPGGGPPLGAARGWTAARSVDLPIGAVLTLYTDGLVERRGADIAEGIDHLTLLLDDASTDVAAIPALLVDTLMPTGADDDIALLVARVSDRAYRDQAARLSLEKDTRNVARARQFIDATLRNWGMDDDLVFEAQLVTSELVTNAFVHAGSDAELSVRASGQKLFIEVRDRVSTVPQPRNALPSEANGRGLAIVATIAQRWGTRQERAGKSVWCELTIPGLSLRGSGPRP